MFLYRLPDGSSSNRLRPGRWMSLTTCCSLLRQRELYSSSSVGREQPGIFWAELMTEVSVELLFDLNGLGIEASQEDVELKRRCRGDLWLGVANCLHRQPRHPIGRL